MTDDLPALEPVPEDWEVGLAIVAHPDDMEYGASAAVSRWTDQGKTVAYALVTVGEAGIDGMAPEEAGPLRIREQYAACEAVGVTDLQILGHPDGMLEYGLRLRADIAGAIRRVRPEMVITLNHRETFGPAAGSTWPTTSSPVGPSSTPCATPPTGGCSGRWSRRRAWSRGAACAGWRWPTRPSRPTPCPSRTHDIDRAVASLEAHDAYLKGLGPGRHERPRRLPPPPLRRRPPTASAAARHDLRAPRHVISS